MEILMVHANQWAFTPVLVAIVAVFMLRDVIASLVIGIGIGAFIDILVSHGGLRDFLNLLFTTLFDSAIENIPLISFMLLLGSLVSLIKMSGGHYAYGQWAAKKIKKPQGISLATIALGMLIFIDDYFSCLLTGAVMGPTLDKYKISREKLAYLIDSTAAPVCILAPVSSWTMTIAHTVEEAGIDNGLLTFVRSIPYNYYAIFALLFVFYIAITQKDFSYMKTYELKARSNKEQLPSVYGIEREINKKAISDKGTILDLVLPNVTVIVLMFVCIIWLGGGFGPEKKSFVEVYAEADTILAGNFACIGSLGVCFLLYILRKRLTVPQFFEGAIEGMKSMFAAVLMLILAWTLSKITIESLGGGAYFESILAMIQDSVNLQLLPVLIFVLSAVMAFGLGSWGTFLITIPFIAIVANTFDPSRFYLFLAATLGGSVFGDHASPITDTTILASIGSQCNHIGHVKSQLPYALLVCLGSAGAFMFIGFMENLALSYALGLALIIGALILIYRLEKRSNNDRSIQQSI